MYLYPYIYLHSNGEDAVGARRVLVERMLSYRPVSFSLDNVYTCMCTRRQLKAPHTLEMNGVGYLKEHV